MANPVAAAAVAAVAPAALRSGRLQGQRKQHGLLLLLPSKITRNHQANICKPGLDTKSNLLSTLNTTTIKHNGINNNDLKARLDGARSGTFVKQNRRPILRGAFVLALILSIHGILATCYDPNAPPIVHSVDPLRLQYPGHVDASFIGQSPTQPQPQHPHSLNVLQNNFWTTNGTASLSVAHQNRARSLTIPTTTSFSSDPSDEALSVGSSQTGDGSVAGIADVFSAFFNNNQNQNNKNPSQYHSPPRDSLDSHVRKILIPRVSGTSGNTQVRNYIVDFLKSNNYHVQLDEFRDHTPVGEVAFANIIATSDQNACRQLVIACHHDSKKMDGFLGAIDSAVPCAMMLELAQAFNRSFRDTDEPAKDRLGLSFVFFDGEEAFVDWTETDSLYGSRHLARKWELQPSPEECPGKNELNRIELLVVLDLIGTTDTHFVMYNRQLKQHYQALQNIEKIHLSNKRLPTSQIKAKSAFKSRYIPLEFMQDDHVPFYKRGVPTLSLLASPFPSVWHTINDNYQAIDFERTKHLLHVLKAFIDEYKPIETTS